MSGEAELQARLLAAVGGKERFARSFDGRSHFPEKLAERTLADAAGLWSAGRDALSAANLPAADVEAWDAKFLRLWLAYQAAGSRVMNWFITGPANFPVERNRKRMEIERRRCDEFYQFATGAAEWIRRRNRSAEKAALAAVSAITEHPEKPFPGGRLVQNTTLDRVQLVFDGRPDAGVIAELKSRAFRWSPREGAWQRQLTRNGMWAAEAVLAFIAKAEAA